MTHYAPLVNLIRPPIPHLDQKRVERPTVRLKRRHHFGQERGEASRSCQWLLGVVSPWIERVPSHDPAGTTRHRAALPATSLYRSDLDPLTLDGDGNIAADGLFWYDPEAGTGVLEPMRTQDDHQRRGLARHILTTGIDLLTAASHLYLGVGFEPHTQTDLFSGRVSTQLS